jgi:hypothetical protein
MSNLLQPACDIVRSLHLHFWAVQVLAHIVSSVVLPPAPDVIECRHPAADLCNSSSGDDIDTFGQAR